MKKIIECVPNFSEGRDHEKIEKIVSVFRGKEGVKLLDYSSDADHNRSVVTLVGEPEALKEAILEFVGVAIKEIDMTKHTGQHPRMGAVDVIPFIPVKDVTTDECVELSKEIGNLIWTKYNFPVFLYEKSASSKERQNLSNIRKGQFEGMPEKIKSEQWKPDFGENKIHPTAGVVAVGARPPLVAFNVNLNTSDIKIADKIARNIRNLNGGYKYVKAMGVELTDRGIVQVSINMTDFNKTALYRVFETIKFEAARWGVSIAGSEIIGLVPMMALIDTAEYYLGLENFKSEQILETRIME
ncbi:MAG: glutamate formimidoyltransferase [Thermotogae bacterium]|nr:glutamate formimidoyltransferase [Thermotogota bacterium]MCP5465168.1 glutamate formimidoyltransferase [Thermotogota bacterium]HOO74911.1 glutamate formimidoyltransferase [Tepiditoga sp.]